LNPEQLKHLKYTSVSVCMSCFGENCGPEMYQKIRRMSGNCQAALNFFDDTIVHGKK
jgi:hypothetical protein